VVTSEAHGLTVGTRVIISMRGAGMPQMDGLTGTIQSVTANTFTLNINSTAFSPHVTDPIHAYWILARTFDLIDQSAAAYPGDPYRGVAEDVAATILTGTSPSGLMEPGEGTLPAHDTPSTGFWQQNQSFASARGLDLSMYEGGLHLIGNGFLQGYPEQNTVGNRFTDMLLGISHRPEMADVYVAYAEGFMDMGGIEPSKFVEGGLASRFGAWAGVRYWPSAADPDGDLDNPVWTAVKAVSMGA
jgi:hypothetical protein